MSCSNCKKKSKIREEIKNGTDFVGRGVIYFFIIWSLLAIYGLYSLITKLL